MQKNKVNHKPEKLSEMIKEATFLYGADLIGITDLNPNWVFSQGMVKSYILEEKVYRI
jgi:hypothetical protein